MSGETPLNTTDEYIRIPFGNGKITRRVKNPNYEPPTTADTTATGATATGATATGATVDTSAPYSGSSTTNKIDEDRLRKEEEAKRAKESGNNNFYRKPNVEATAAKDKEREEIRQKDLASMKYSSKGIGVREDYNIGGKKMRKSRKSRKSRKMRKSRR